MHGLIVNTSRGSDPLSGGGWLVDEPLFRLLIDFEIQKARRLRYSVSLMCFAIESPTVGNGEAGPVSMAERIVRYVRGTDVVALSGQGWYSMLLVDAESTHLPSIFGRFTTRFETAGWSAGGSSYPRTAARAEDMVQQAVELLTRARREGGNRLYVAS